MSTVRTVYARTGCGCSMPGLLKLLDREHFEHQADLRKARGKRRPIPTEVGRFVEARQARLRRKLAAVLVRQRAAIKRQILAAYEKRLGKAQDDTRKTVEEILRMLNSDDLGVDLTGALSGPMLEAFRRAASRGVTQIGIPETEEITKQLDRKALAYAQERSGELVTDFANTTIESLRSVVARGVEEGMSTDELADAIDEAGAFGEARAEMIARTELANAHVQGNVEGWRESGEVVAKQSILGDLHDIQDQCDDCAEAGVVPLEDEFVDGYDFPPYHPNCICDIKPVLDNEQA